MLALVLAAAAAVPLEWARNGGANISVSTERPLPRAAAAASSHAEGSSGSQIVEAKAVEPRGFGTGS